MAKRVDNPNTDNLQSWISAAACMFMFCSVLSVYKTSGVFYISIMRTFNVPRQTASWPLTVSDIVMSLTGPFAAQLAIWFDIGIVAIIGSVLGASGVIMSYFCHDVVCMTSFLGVVYGMGLGMIITVTPIIINQKFLRYKATASGIAYTGASIASFVFPPFVHHLLDLYSLRGSLLVMGGIVLNCLVASFLIQSLLKSELGTKVIRSRTKDSESGTRIQNAICKNMPPRDGNQQEGPQNKILHKTAAGTASYTFHELQNSTPPNIERKNKPKIDETLNNSEKGKANDKNNLNNSQNNCNQIMKTPLNQTCDIATIIHATIDKNKRKRHKFSHCFRKLSSWRLIRLLRKPIYYIIMVGNISIYICCRWYLMVVVDFAIDKGIEESDAVFVISLFSIMDLIGRSCCGWITDRGLLQRKHMMSLCLMMVGISMEILVLGKDYAFIVTVTMILGLFIGVAMPLMNVLMAECIGLEFLGMGVGICNFIYGLLSFSRPPIIGYVRDQVKSYDQLFLWIGTLTIFSALLWIGRSIFEACNYKNTDNCDTVKKSAV